MQDFWNKENSWCWAPQQNAWIYSDADSYYKAFIKACSEATRQIVIAGWDMHSETNLAPDWEGSWYPKYWSLNQFLLRLLHAKPQLHIYLLSWDFAPFYFLEREKLQSLRFAFFSHPRLHFQMDGAHPIGGSQHQKFVVVDRSLAFLGGLDLTIRRWDTSEHKARNRLRRDPQGLAYGAFHDIQIGFSGSLVKEMEALFRERWNKATDMPLPELPDAGEHPGSGETTDSFPFAQVPMALSRTSPRFREISECLEIAGLYRDLIQSARRHILIENQYLTSRLIVQALKEVLAKTDGPEVIIILPQLAGGWLEKNTMGLLQNQALSEIKKADHQQRLHIFAPENKKMKKARSVTVHSKIMVIDSGFLTVGSANLNNRSMGLDSECNATLDLREPRLSKQLQAFTAEVLAHHTQGKAADILPLLDQGDSFHRAIQRLNEDSPKRFLMDFPVISNNLTPIVDEFLIDADKPILFEEGMDRWGHWVHLVARKLRLPTAHSLLVFGGVLLVVGLMAWYALAPQSKMIQDSLLQYLQKNQQNPLVQHGLVPLAFAIGCLLFVPINILILATIIFFPLGHALIHIILGTIANVATGYVEGQVLRRFFSHSLFGPKADKVLRRISKGHFTTLLALRIVPIAPNSLINITAGVSQIPFFRFLGATLLGMTPGVFLLALFQRSLFSMLRKPEFPSIALILILCLLTTLLILWTRRRFSHYGGV